MNSSKFVAQYMLGILLDIHWRDIRGGDDYDKDGDRNHYDFGYIPITVCFELSFLMLLFFKETLNNLKNKRLI